jgi:Tyrosine phosphatase family
VIAQITLLSKDGLQGLKTNFIQVRRRMTDGGKIARRSTRAFANDFHTGHEKASSELHSPTVRGREGKYSDMDSSSSCESSVSSGPLTEFEMELRKETGWYAASRESMAHALQIEHLFGPPAPALKADPSKPFKEKIIEGRPLNFGIVMPRVYRSAYPRAEDHEYLKSLGLKTIVYAKDCQ